MIDDIIRTQIRVPGPLYEELKERAEQNHHSLNSEMILRLQASLTEQEQLLKRMSLLEQQNQNILQLLQQLILK
ncbi:Arc family DNA-binding protein [Iodobacter sp. CM08]|uniref:Arc family DNA-binding protein n=1 Tax=Iodobacter sp. CM08 TaxID=3085902 RepID=UPI002981950B|nr:Arc family DNA-binding protein [Iodobacter sp. CM08]MDW5417724.1 Arc family DNA-binding protein [Iodobacter sp. CM08]